MANRNITNGSLLSAIGNQFQRNAELLTLHLGPTTYKFTNGSFDVISQIDLVAETAGQTEFTVPGGISATRQFYINGVLLHEGVDYTISGNVLTLIGIYATSVLTIEQIIDKYTPEGIAAKLWELVEYDQINSNTINPYVGGMLSASQTGDPAPYYFAPGPVPEPEYSDYPAYQHPPDVVHLQKVTSSTTNVAEYSWFQNGVNWRTGESSWVATRELACEYGSINDYSPPDAYKIRLDPNPGGTYCRDNYGLGSLYIVPYGRSVPVTTTFTSYTTYDWFIAHMAAYMTPANAADAINDAILKNIISNAGSELDPGDIVIYTPFNPVEGGVPSPGPGGPDGYLALGDWLGFSDVDETSDMTIASVTITLSGINVDTVYEWLTEDYIDKQVYIHRVYFDDDWRVIGNPVLLFDGRIDQPAIRDTGTEVTIGCRASSQWVDFTRRNGRYTSDQLQKAIFPGDLGFQYSAVDTPGLKWGG